MAVLTCVALPCDLAVVAELSKLCLDGIPDGIGRRPMFPATASVGFGAVFSASGKVTD